jgi:hypothetical protein
MEKMELDLFTQRKKMGKIESPREEDSEIRSRICKMIIPNVDLDVNK